MTDAHRDPLADALRESTAVATEAHGYIKALRGVLSMCNAADILWPLSGRTGEPTVWTSSVREVIAEALDLEVPE